MEDFRDVLIGSRHATVTIVDHMAYLKAVAELELEAALPAGIAGALEWLRRTGEVLPGVEVRIEEQKEA